MAATLRIPFVLVLSSSGADVSGGVASLHGWGRAARALAACSGVVPVVVVVTGPALSGPALLLGLADVVVMTGDAFAFVSGPTMVEDFTGIRIGVHQLGGSAIHARSSGLCAIEAASADQAMEHVAHLLGLLPGHTDDLPPARPAATGRERRGACDRSSPTGPPRSYDVRRVAAALADDGDVTELWPRWSPQLVTALGRIDGRTVGFVANQSQALAGTLDIAASQKGARFVRFCDAFNIPLVTLVDTPGFLPGKDLEWRGMIRHGAELAFAYAEATVPRICVILRKAFGGAYIVMDSKGLGNDLCVAWPGAEIAVMGAEGAVQILYRRVDAATSGPDSRTPTPSASSPRTRRPNGASSTPSSIRPTPGTSCPRRSTCWRPDARRCPGASTPSGRCRDPDEQGQASPVREPRSRPEQPTGSGSAGSLARSPTSTAGAGPGS